MLKDVWQVIIFLFLSLPLLSAQPLSGDNERSTPFERQLAQLESELLQNSGDTLAIGRIYGSFGDTYVKYRQFEHGLIYYQRAYQIFQQFNDTSAMHTLEIDLGKTALQSKNNTLADFFLNQALSYYQQNNNVPAVDLLLALQQLALQQNNLKKAEKLLSQIRSTAKANRTWNSSLQRRFLLQKSKTQLRSNNRTATLQSLTTAANIPLRTQHDLTAAKIHYQLASLGNDLDEQLRAVQRALALISKNFYDSSPLKNPKSNDTFLDKSLTISILNLKTFLLTAKWQTQELETRWLERALETVQVTDKVIAAYRRDLAEAPQQKKAALPYFLLAYEQGIETAQLLYRLRGEARYFDAAYYFTERNKAILLSEAKAVAAAFADAKIPQKLLDERRQLKTKLRVAPTAEQRFQLQRNYDRLTHQLFAKYPDYLAQQYDAVVPAVTAIQEQLDEQTVIVSYAMNEVLDEYIYRNDHRRMYIYTISQDELTITVRPWKKQLDQQISDLYQLLQKRSLVRRSKRERFIQLSHQLYRALIRPIERYISDNQHIIFIGEDQLNYLPFDVLLRENEADELQNLRYLLSDFSISYHYSSSLFYQSLAQSKARNNHKIFAFAPVFTDNDTAINNSSQTQSVAIDSTRMYLRGDRFQPLPATATEVENIQEIWQQQFKAADFQTAIFAQANKQQLQTALDQPFAYIHLATHSFANLKQPDSTGVACFPTPATTPLATENILFIHEIYPLQITADLVTLSSCESGVGQFLVGEGMLGLNRAFLYAGARNVLFSLWKVNDTTTAQLMAHFYKNVSQGMNYASALRNAKLDLLTKKTSSLPVYWSAFQLVGK